MTTRSGLTDLEARLRAALFEIRPADGASASLRGRIDVVPDRLGSQGVDSRLRQLVASPFAAAMILGATSLVLLALSWQAVVSPVGSGGVPPTTGGWDPTIEGPGIRYDAPFVLPIVAGCIALTALVLAILAFVRWRRAGGLRGIVALVVLGAIVALSVGLALEPGVIWASFYGPQIGYAQVDPLPGASGENVPIFYETVGPNQPVALAFDIQNPGALPITLLGVVEDPNAPEMAIYRWTAVWLGQDPTRFGFTDDAVLFQPRTLEPGEGVVVFLVGKSGPCAYGPGYATAQDVGGYTNRGRQLRFAYSVLGLPTSAELTLPVEIVEPIRNGPCP